MRQATPLPLTHTHSYTHTQVHSMRRSGKEFISLAKGLITFSVHLAPLAPHALLSNANQQKQQQQSLPSPLSFLHLFCASPQLRLPT